MRFAKKPRKLNPFPQKAKRVLKTISEAIEVRDYRPSTDKNFIYSAWLKHYKTTSYFAKRIRPAVFFKYHEFVVDRILARSTARVLVAFIRNDGEECLLGFLCYEPSQDGSNPLVHFIYTKELYRRFGVAKALFRAADIAPPHIAFTHWTSEPHDIRGNQRGVGTNHFMELWPGMIYNPYRQFYENPQ